MDHFSILAPWYDRIIRPKDPQKLIDLAELPVNGLVLDAGGGTGRVAQTLTVQAGKVVVSDSSLRMLQQASIKDNLQLTCSQSENLAFSNDSFERILMVDAFHHVLDQRLTAQELWRVLKPGGRLIIEEPDIRCFSIKILAVLEKVALMRSHFMEPAAIAGLFPRTASHMRIETENYNAWVIIDKQGI